MSTGRPHHYGHLLQVYKESLQPLTLYTSFHDLINEYSRRSGADNPSGQNFAVNKPLVTSVIHYKFQKNLFEVWFYTIFFMILYRYIHVAPGQGLTTPTGRNFYVNRNILSLWSFVASCKKISLDQIWTCRKIGQGQPRVIIYIDFVELESPMIHAKFQDHRTSGSGEEDF